MMRRSLGIETVLPRLAVNVAFKWPVCPLRLFSKTHHQLLPVRLEQLPHAQQQIEAMKKESMSSAFKLHSCTTRR